MMNRRQLLGFLPMAFAVPVLANEPEKAGPAAKRTLGADRRSLLGLLIKTREGRPAALADHAGRVLVINLWGPWCVPCRREMPSLSRLHDHLKGLPVVLLPVAFDHRGADGVQQFYETNNITNLPVLTGDGENLLAVTGKSHLPLTLIADGEGNWISTVEGEAIWDDAETLGWLAGLAKA